MITLGIDLSSQPKGTATCLMDWSAKKLVVIEVKVKCDDRQLDELIEQASVVGIDAPFGWPETFRAAVANWTAKEWVGQDDFQRQPA